MKIDLEGRTGKDAFKFLKENKRAIYDLKKNEIKLADACAGAEIVKAAKTNTSGKYLYENNISEGVLKRTCVCNTYYWLDSHDDVHLANLFSKSITERGELILHLHDHLRELGAKVGIPISWKEVNIPWSDLGVTPVSVDKLVPAPTSTQALLLESSILKRYNPQVYEMYLNNEINQHSVGMRYVKFDLAINDPDDSYYKDEYNVWKEVFPKLGNQQKAFDQGYFFAVKEAILIENSAVLLGANEITPVLGSKIEPVKTTQQNNIKPAVPLDVKSIIKNYLN